MQYKTHVIDRLSNMPYSIIDNILGRLPIKDAMKTCVLSRQWRENWTKMSTLAFDEICGGNSKNVLYDGEQFTNFIYRFLFSHSGPVHTLKIILDYNFRIFDTEMDEWLNFVMTNDIKEITLQWHTGGKYQVPSCLFSCKQLSYLSLYGMILKVPDNFRGFHNLVGLQLRDFSTTAATDSIDAKAFGNLISNCPVLMTLELIFIYRMFDPLVIQAPKLKYLHIFGNFGGVILQSCPLLEDGTSVENSTSYVSDDRQGRQMTINFLKNLYLLSDLRSLRISTSILKVITN